MGGGDDLGVEALEEALAAAGALRDEGRLDEAAAAYAEVVARFDADAPGRRRAKRIAGALAARSRLLSELGRHEEALAADEQVIAYERRRPPAKSERGERRRRARVGHAQLDRGRQLRRLGRFGEALAVYAALLDDEEGHGDDVVAEAHHGRALALGEQGRPEEALAACEAGLARVQGASGRDARVAAARLTSTKARLLELLGRADEAGAVRDALAAEFGASIVPEIRALLDRRDGGEPRAVL